MVKSTVGKPEKGSTAPEPMYRRLGRAFNARGSNAGLVVASALMFAVVFALTLWWRAAAPPDPAAVEIARPDPDVAAEAAGEDVPALDPEAESLPPAGEEVPAVAAPAAPPAGQLIWPVAGPVVKEYGWHYTEMMAEWRHHGGLDIAAAQGDAVRAVYAGTVTAVERDPLWGWTVVVEHSPGYTSRYAGCERVLVEAGAVVETGQIIAYAGAAADLEAADDPHLHFELIWDGQKVDPVAVLPAQAP